MSKKATMDILMSICLSKIETKEQIRKSFSGCPHPSTFIAGSLLPFDHSNFLQTKVHSHGWSPSRRGGRLTHEKDVFFLGADFDVPGPKLYHCVPIIYLSSNLNPYFPSGGHGHNDNLITP